MGRSKNGKTGGWRSLGEILGSARPVVFVVLILLIAAGAVGAGLYYMRQQVEKKLAFPDQPPVVVLAQRPAWMSEGLAKQIADSARPKVSRSAMDHQLLVEVGEVISRNPWVRQLRHVRRVYGNAPGDTIQIDADFRAPMALVPCRNEYILVDSEGYRLPQRFPITQTPPAVMFSDDRHVNLRIIEGVGAMPPYRDGEKWIGEDLQAGLDMARLLYGKPFADEIHRVNVANFKGRKSQREAQIVLVTRYGSEVRWGEPLKATFNDVAAAIKLERLATLRQRFGRVDASHPWIDIRFDKITYPEQPGLVQVGN